MRSEAKELAFRMLHRLGAVTAARWHHRQGAIVLTYHAVTDVDQSLYRRFPLVYRNAVTSAQLELHLSYLKRHYSLLTAREFLDCLGRAHFPPHSVLLAFDDGLQCQARLAGPLLASVGLPGIVFLPTGMIDEASSLRASWQWTEAVAALVYSRSAALRQQWSLARSCIGPLLQTSNPNLTDEDLIQCLWTALWRLHHTRRLRVLRELADMVGGFPDPAQFPADRHGASVLTAMSWTDALTLLEEGLDLGGHSVNHSLMSELLPEETEREILGCMERIKEVCDRTPQFFAYPYGVVGQGGSLGGTFQRAGIRAGLTSRYGFVGPLDDPYLLPRIGVPGGCTTSRLAYYASGLKAIARPILYNRAGEESGLQASTAAYTQRDWRAPNKDW